MELILEKLSKTKTNAEFLDSMSAPAPGESDTAIRPKKEARALSKV
jgi:hypothetical protein